MLVVVLYSGFLALTCLSSTKSLSDHGVGGMIAQLLSRVSNLDLMEIYLHEIRSGNWLTEESVGATTAAHDSLSEIYAIDEFARRTYYRMTGAAANGN